MSCEDVSAPHGRPGSWRFYAAYGGETLLNWTHRTGYACCLLHCITRDFAQPGHDRDCPIRPENHAIGPAEPALLRWPTPDGTRRTPEHLRHERPRTMD